MDAVQWQEGPSCFLVTSGERSVKVVGTFSFSLIGVGLVCTLEGGVITHNTLNSVCHRSGNPADGRSL